MHTRVLRNTPRNLATLAHALRRGQLVAVPSETVYGLACLATDAAACEQVFAAKGRPRTDPLIVHVHSMAQARTLAVWNDTAQRLAKRFWPGPLTLVLPKTELVPDMATADLPSVAIRMPAHPVFRALLKTLNAPLAAPSANPFGYISPTTSEHVKKGLGGRIPYILEGGDCERGLESTILDARTPERISLLRAGAITLEDIAKCLGHAPLRTTTPPPQEKDVAAVAPGMLTKHYSPRTAIELHETIPAEIPPTDAALYFQRRGEAEGKGSPNQFYLTEQGALEHAARNLFARLHALDDGTWTRIHVEMAPCDTGLGLAINDRLRRAASRG